MMFALGQIHQAMHGAAGAVGIARSDLVEDLAMIGQAVARCIPSSFPPSSSVRVNRRMRTWKLLAGLAAICDRVRDCPIAQRRSPAKPLKKNTNCERMSGCKHCDFARGPRATAGL